MSHVHIDMSAQLRRARALELRIAGKQWKEIAQIVGYPSASAAFKGAQALLDDTVSPIVEDMRKVEDLRLDAMLSAVWDKAVGFTVIDEESGAGVKIDPDLDYLAAALRISARRAKLWGLDAKVDNGDFIPGQV